MDNLTHTVIGLIAGETFAQTRVARESTLAPATKRVLLIALTIIGSNLPDLDLLISYRGFSRNKLDYMLEHRGYTHTLLGCLFLAAALYALVELGMRWRKLTPSLPDRVQLGAAALSGTLLHLGMDFLNSYGVHPFWPFVNKWYYGDSVFIVEPLYWIAALPLLFVQRTWAAKAFVARSGAAAILASALTGLVPLSIVLVLVLLAATLLVIGRRSSQIAASRLSAVMFIAVTTLFVTSGVVAARQSAELPAFGRVLDHVLTPMPANPVCWDLLLLQKRDGIYRIRHGILSIAPSLLPARACPQRLPNASTTAQLTAVEDGGSSQILWLGEVELPADSFGPLMAEYCDAAALMRFARVPFTAPLQNALVIGDFRFDREPGLGFSELPLLPTQRGAGQCKPRPPWQPPRADLLK